MNARRSLTRQINRRLLLALSLATVFSTIVGFWVYRESNERAMAAQISTLKTHLVGALAQVERSWGREAYNYRARLEYSRILEDPATRTTRLASYLTAQGGSPTFPYVRILDADRRPLATHAYGPDHLPAVEVPDGTESIWVWDETSQTLFRVFEQHVWLGNGNGHLQLFKPADHALLNALEVPGSNILMFWGDDPVASSLGEEGMEVARPARARLGGDERRWVDWGGAGSGTPRLFVLPDEVKAFAPADLAVPLGIATLVFALATWGALGRWSVLSLRRVQAIRHAQEQFAEDRAIDPEVEAALAVARGTMDDEISDVADTLLMMMSTIVLTEASEIEARESLMRNERRYRLMIEGTRAIAWEYDPAGDRYEYVSPQAEAMLGYPAADWTEAGFFARLAHEDQRQEIIERRRQNMAGGAPGMIEYRARRRDGSEVWLQDLTSPFSDGTGGPRRILGLTLDITERKRTEDRLILSDLVVRNAGEGIVVTDAENRIISVNPAFEQVTGYSADEVIGRNPSLLKSGLQDRAFYEHLWQALATRGRWSGELWNRRKNGEIYAQRASIVAVPANQGLPARHVALFADITLEKHQEEELAYQAAHDPLTGLPNRRLLGDRVDSALARGRRDGTHVGILLIDLDGFKQINDTLGHLLGDRVLIEVAKRIQRTMREADTLARIGGDEFMIVVEGLDDLADLQGIASKALEHIQEPLHLDNAELYVTASIGITVAPGDGHTLGRLFANADTALYRAKAEGRNSFRFFTAEMHTAAIARMAVETELRRAIPNNEFLLHYQPVVELATGRIAKAEALVRWLHPEQGLVPPGRFIPVAEDTGMILPIGDWIVGEAARQAAAWDQHSPEGFKICVNFSAYQFRRGDPLGLLARSLACHGVGSGHIAVEVTESLFMDDQEDTLAQLHLLREQGFEIAIDDFGTGYSSLSYLQRLPVDTLKIDQSFVSGIPDNPRSMGLIEAMLSLGRSFGIAVIAEGIETEVQADYLRERGCRYGQGYYFGRPVPPEELAARHFPSA